MFYRPSFLDYIVGCALGFFLGMVLVTYALPSSAEDTFYQWVDENGTVNLTDDTKRIPEKDKDKAKERSFSELSEASAWTTLDEETFSRLAALEERLSKARALNPKPEIKKEDCSGPFTITKERQDYKERGQHFNSMFFIQKNSCGEVISITREQPRTPLVVRP